MLTVGFWLSASLLLDLLVMPSLYVSGMMSQPGFAAAGYTLFGLFNRLEIICGALILTGLLVLRSQPRSHGVVISGLRSRWALEGAILMLLIAVIYAYGVTPMMGALGLSLQPLQAQPTPDSMALMHLGYWGLELLKLAGGALVLLLGLRDLPSIEDLA